MVVLLLLLLLLSMLLLLPFEWLQQLPAVFSVAVGVAEQLTQ
jgi:hypothetical protein